MGTEVLKHFLPSPTIHTQSQYLTLILLISKNILFRCLYGN